MMQEVETHHNSLVRLLALQDKAAEGQLSTAWTIIDMP